jgi:hypothetical protein
MSDFSTPLRLSESQFHALIEKLETAFARRQAALVLNSQYGNREIQILDYSALELDDTEFEAVLWLDQLLYFGMQLSSDELIRDWAGQFDDALGDLAVERARALRTSLPSVAAAWDAKAEAAVPILASPRSEVVFDREGAPRALFVLPSIAMTPGGEPDFRSRQETVLELFPDDVAYLQTELSYLSNEMDRERVEESS